MIFRRIQQRKQRENDRKERERKKEGLKEAFLACAEAHIQASLKFADMVGETHLIAQHPQREAAEIIDAMQLECPEIFERPAARDLFQLMVANQLAQRTRSSLYA